MADDKQSETAQNDSAQEDKQTRPGEQGRQDQQSQRDQERNELGRGVDLVETDEDIDR
jgi:hypothetical protein